MSDPRPPTELILSQTQRSLGQVQLETIPQPGGAVLYGGVMYTVLERRHRYQFRANRYHLQAIALYVQAATPGEDKTWLGDRWVIGDATCQYNAQSPLLRCALQPDGPCGGCGHYQPRSTPRSP